MGHKQWPSCQVTDSSLSFVGLSSARTGPCRQRRTAAKAVPAPARSIRPLGHAKTVLNIGHFGACLAIFHSVCQKGTGGKCLNIRKHRVSLTVARTFRNRWVMRYGVPKWATTDNGGEFGGAFAHQLERMGVALVHSSPYHPQANRAFERVVHTTKQILYAKTAVAVSDWRPLPMPRREWKLRPGDPAYLLERRGQRQNVAGPYVVEEVTAAGGAAVLRSTAQFTGQAVKKFRVHLSNMARCTSLVDTLQKLYRQHGWQVQLAATSAEALVTSALCAWPDHEAAAVV